MIERTLQDIVERLFSWCISKNINIHQSSSNTRCFEIPEFGKLYLLLPNNKGKIIDSGMRFITVKEDIEFCKKEDVVNYLLYEFGQRFYYCKIEFEKDEYNEERLNVNFNDLMYVGIHTCKIPNFNHLGVHTEYEILNGSGLKNYIAKAKFLEIEYLGLCDKHTLAGTLAFQSECDKKGIKSIIGATYNVVEILDTTQSAQNTYEIRLYVMNDIGWTNLLSINKSVNVDFDRFVLEEDLFKHTAGLICILGRNSFIDFTYKGIWYKKLLQYNKLFEKLYIQIDSVEFYDDEVDMKNLYFINNYFKQSEQVKNILQPILINDSYYTEKDEYIVKEYLNKVAKVAADYSEDQYYKTADQTIEQLIELFDDTNTFLEFYKECVASIEELCVKCSNFKIETGERKFPKYEYTEGMTSEQFFDAKVSEGFIERVVEAGFDVDVYMERLQKECVVIKDGNLCDFFLILWDIVSWCAENGIMVGPGRGSVVGSLVSYCLKITSVNPLEYDLLFERFLDESRTKPEIIYVVKDNSTGELKKLYNNQYEEQKDKVTFIKTELIYNADSADVDFDITSEYRDTVKEYVKTRFGELYSCSIGSYTRLKLKGGIKDFGTAKGLKFDYLNYITKKIENQIEYSWRDFIDYIVNNDELKKFAQLHPDLIHTIKFALNQPKAASIHASGVLVLPKLDKQGNNVDIYGQLPVRLVEEKIISEWEGKYTDLAGFLKEDMLSLTELHKFTNILKLIKKNQQKEIDLDKINFKDIKVYKLFQKGYNEDVFQFNSNGLKQYSRLVKPDNMEDLIAMNALYRPGPMSVNAHTDFALMKHGKKKLKFDYGLQEITKHTQGLVIYQEQMMQSVVSLGNFTLVESNKMRTATKKFQRKDMQVFEDKFINGAIGNGCPSDEAKRIWDKIIGFSKYGFNKSHSAAYAKIAYQSQWFKANYPLEFWCTALQFSEEEAIPAVISEMKKANKNIQLRPPSINDSTIEFTCSTDTNSIYWSLIKIKNIGQAVASSIISERKKQIFSGYDDFVERMQKSSVNKRHITFMILAGCFDIVENIKLVTERYDLLLRHIKEKNITLPEIFNDEVQVHKKYFWIIEQKKLTGYGVIDYALVLKESQLKNKKQLQELYVDYEALQKCRDYTEVVVCGKVFELQKLKAKKKEKYFFIITLVHNYDIIKVLIWEDISEQFEEFIQQMTNQQMAFEGIVKYDTYNSENSVYVSEELKYYYL